MSHNIYYDKFGCGLFNCLLSKCYEIELKFKIKNELLYINNHTIITRENIVRANRNNVIII